MGWASGSELANELWSEIKPLVPKKHRESVATAIYEKFSDADAADWSLDDELIIDGKIAQKEEWEDWED